MFLTFYTRAVILKIQQAFPNSYYSLPEQLLEKAANKNLTNNLPLLPVIGIYRTGWEMAPNQNYEPKFQGVNQLRGRSDADGKFYKAKRAEVRINFQFEVLSDKQSEMDRMAEEFFWFLSNSPRVSFYIPQPIQLVVNDANLIYQGVSDNSEPSSFKDTGYIYRTTYDFSLEGAYLMNFTDWEEVLTVDFKIVLI